MNVLRQPYENKHYFGGIDKFTVDRTGIIFGRSFNQSEYKIEPLNEFSMSVIEERYRIEVVLLEAIEHGDDQKAMICHQLFRKIQTTSRLPDRLRELKNYLLILNTLYRMAISAVSISKPPKIYQP